MDLQIDPAWYTIVKVANAVKAKDMQWIFLVAQHEMSCLEMDEQGLLGI